MKIKKAKLSFLKIFMCLSIGFILTHSQLHGQVRSLAKVKNDFKRLLARPSVPLNPTLITSITTDSVIMDKGFFYSEATEKVPFLILKPVSAGTKKLPLVICLHGTGGNKEGMQSLLFRFVQAGFIAVAIDGRYYGDREKAVAGQNKYVEAIINAWQSSDQVHQEHPFFYDTVYDTWKLVDYLQTRSDVDPNRIGMMGISKGGIETIMAAALDTRIKVAVPIIAAQSFKWSLENDRWQGRAKTIWNAHRRSSKGINIYMSMAKKGLFSHIKERHLKLLKGLSQFIIIVF